MKLFTLAFMLFSQVAFAELNCEKNLVTFLKSISQSRDFQEKAISYPLKYTYVGTQIEDMPFIEKLLSENDVKAAEFPVFPLKPTQKSHGLVQQILEQSKVSAKVSIFKPETDYSLTYTFKVKSGCWSLVEYINNSL